jgi:predicted metal-dependent phosphoesterase TrpH
MRCDLHVHSRFSGRCTVPVLRNILDECFSEPEEVYDAARKRGMDLVTLTDHDTITGALRLLRRPGTFVSEEVTCVLPDERMLHLGVYDLSERQHEGVAARRLDAERLFAFLAEQHLPVSLNHPFSALTGRRRTEDLDLGFSRCTLVETRNGMLPAETNDYAARTAAHKGLATMGGSDSHTLHGVARAYTVVPGARTREEFLAGLRQGFTVPAGRSGTYAGLVRELMQLAVQAYFAAARDGHRSIKAAAASLGLVAASPIVPLLPLVGAFVHVRERWFADHHFRLYEAGTERALAPVPVVDPAAA